MNPPAFVRKDLQVTVYSEALVNNLGQLRSLCAPGVKFCAVVKANGHGHGIVNVVNILKDTDVDFFGVANVFEGIHISPLIDKQKIIVFDPIYPGQDSQVIALCAQKGIHCSISSLEAVDYVSFVLANTNLSLPVHINLDTGMGRSGAQASQAKKLWTRIKQADNLKLAGLYTNFATADEDDLSFAREQLKRYNNFLADITQDNRNGILIHAANTAATIQLPEAHFDMVRCGIGLYGYTAVQKPLPIELIPALKLEAPLVHLLQLPKGESVSYGRRFFCQRPTMVGVLPIGYADGIWRCFSHMRKAKINQTIIPVIGTVTMNQTLVDVTNVSPIRLGQLVTVIDNDFDSPCGVYTLADLGDTICDEILAGIPPYARYKIC